MEVLSRKLRPWVCALPQPGWGGTTLAGYVEGVNLRPEVTASEAEVKQILDALLAEGHVHAVKLEKDDEPRWELSKDGHDRLTAMVDPAEGVSVEEVLLELQPGVPVSSAASEVGA